MSVCFYFCASNLKCKLQLNINHSIHRFNNELPHNEILKSLIEEPGIGTTCMEDLSDYVAPFQKCKFTETGFTGNFTVSYYLYLTLMNERMNSYSDEWFFLQGPGYYEEDCACTSSDWICNAGLQTTNTEKWVMNTTDILHDLTKYEGGSIIDWILKTHYQFIDLRFGGWSAANISKYATDLHGKSENLIVWFNNKAPHALPSYVNSIHNAKLRTLASRAGKDPREFGISTYVHPMTLTANQLTLQSM